ncbi:hypothetical protein JVT61DRAFT_774 [Boletus reticuloceps]|uniref:Uncharacterized protein n=1 Tax=Boletus reticuloceps TaxID=495285 RepID=A0A8I3AH25_9AGAM|nr:hypothetical protein JVT61DRAFT_774 [Boletus reticuloceps]
MIPPDSPVSPSWQLEENTLDLTRAASLHCFLLPNSLGLGFHDAGTIPYLPPVSQVDFDPAGVQDHYSAFPESNSSLDSNDSDAMFTPIDVTQGHIPWISSGPEYGMGPALTENPAMNNALQASDEVIWYSVSSAFSSLQIPCTTSPILQALSLGEDIEESLRTTADPLSYPPTAVDIPPTGWATGHPEAGFSPGNPLHSTLRIPHSGSTVLRTGENVQMVGSEAVQSPLYTSIPTPRNSSGSAGGKMKTGHCVTRSSRVQVCQRTWPNTG